MRGSNRPALFYYLVTRLDQALALDLRWSTRSESRIDQDSVKLVKQFYNEWRSLDASGKRAYEDMRLSYALAKGPEMPFPHLRIHYRWFSLIHHRFLSLQHPGMSLSSVSL